MTERCLHSRLMAGGMRVEEHDEAMRLWLELAKQFGMLVDASKIPTHVPPWSAVRQPIGNKVEDVPSG